MAPTPCFCIGDCRPDGPCETEDGSQCPACWDKAWDKAVKQAIDFIIFLDEEPYLGILKTKED